MDRILDPTQGIKPLDFGWNGLTGSVDDMGRLIALNQYHAIEGYVSFSVQPLFTEEHRYDQKAVRRYRASLAELVGFGPYFAEEVTAQRALLLVDAIPRIELEFANGGRATMTILATLHGVVQAWQFDGIYPTHWQGNLSVQRCAYTQLTEGGPLKQSQTYNELHYKEGTLTLENKALGWVTVVSGLPIPNAEAVQVMMGAQPLEFILDGTSDEQIILSFASGETRTAAQSASEQLSSYATPLHFEKLLAQQITHWEHYWKTIPADSLLRRGLVYGQMLCVPVNDEATCILTDHMLLPLSWNRDAYFVARMLLLWGTAQHTRIRQHLLWMFEVAERIDDEWGRCYLANGQLKDPVYQLDQQLFPLLELAEYVEITGDMTLYTRLESQFNRIVDKLLSRKADFGWLFPTDETPADDPVPFPYHFSSHVLAGYTFQKLHALVPAANYAKIAEAIFKDTHHYFVGENGGELCFAYATDGAGNFSFYHDANDTPLVLAPIWGFVTTANPIWQATLRFAFSSANTGGYYQGHLGSVHTPAPWPLGDIQGALAAGLLGQLNRKSAHLAYLQDAAQWDGALSEAYDSTTYQVVSRHWFAWPNAFYAMLKLENLI